MNKTKEEKKSLSTFTKFIRLPSILVSEFLLWKKEPMHLMKRTKKQKKYAAFSQKYYACGPEFSTIKTLTYCEPIVLLSP